MSRLLTRVRRGARRLVQRRKTALADLRAIFDPAWYKSEYADIAGLDGGALFQHFLRHGIAEGRRPNRFFDPVWYAEQNPNLSGEAPLVHYARWGRAARLDPGPNFSVAAYLATHDDVARHGMDALEHFVRFGRKEGRRIFPVRGAADDMAILASEGLPPQVGEALRALPDLPITGEETIKRIVVGLVRAGVSIELRR